MFPQISVTVQFFVIETVHPETTSEAIVPVATSPVLQLSVTEAVPKAAATFAGLALQPKADAAANVITGIVESAALKVCAQVLLQLLLTIARPKV